MRLVIFLAIVCSLYGKSGQDLYKKCIGCHGQDAKHAPFERQNGVIYGRDPEELKIIIKMIKDGTYKGDRLNQIMRNTIQKFSDEDIENVSVYIKFLNAN
ncbi:MAG: cytochrome c [Sulfurospirillum sp.]|nr:cytochrome c [Sulfurospirillum sp.]